MLRTALLGIAFMGRRNFWTAFVVIGCLFAFVVVVGSASLLLIWPYVLVAVATCVTALWLARRYGAPKK